MKTCDEIQLRLDDLRSGELDPDIRADVLAHLDSCAVCRTIYDLEQDLRDTLADLPLVACPGRVSERILDQIVAEPEPVRDRSVRITRRPRNWLPTAALLAAAAVLLVVLLPERDREISPEPIEITQVDVFTARRDALRGLSRAAEIIEKTERATLTDVFGQQLPGAITGPLRSAFADRHNLFHVTVIDSIYRIHCGISYCRIL